MKLHYMGRFSGDPSTLPHGEHKPGAVPFKEPQDPKKLAMVANGIALALLVVLLAAAALRGGAHYSFVQFLLGWLLGMAILFPHELLHAVCFQEDVYLYTNWRQGMLFVVGPEDMSRGRFVLMSLLPNLVFGWGPFLLWCLTPYGGEWSDGLLWFSLCCISFGGGDYLNVWNALRQMPRGSVQQISGFHSYWYMP